MGLTPLVGRADELQTLLQVWQSALDGSRAACHRERRSGYRKSRLVQVMKEHVPAGDERNSSSAKCWSHLSGSAFYPHHRRAAQVTPIGRETSAAEQLEKLEQFLTSLDFSLPENVPLLASLLSIPLPPRYPRLELTPVLQRADLSVLESILYRISARHPLLFVVEDVHWIDQSSLEVIARLREKVSNSRALLLLTCRPEFRSPWAELPSVRHMRLERMSAVTSANLVAQVAHDQGFPPELVERNRCANGRRSPFVELTRVVLARWTQGERKLEALLPEAIPVTLHDLLVAQLDRLVGEDREIAQLCAVLGKSFGYTALVACANRPADQLDEPFTTVPAGYPDESRTGSRSSNHFRHALIQEAGYQSLFENPSSQMAQDGCPDPRRQVPRNCDSAAGIVGAPPPRSRRHRRGRRTLDSGSRTCDAALGERGGG